MNIRPEDELVAHARGGAVGRRRDRPSRPVPVRRPAGRPLLPKIRILVADDHPVVREGLATLISRAPDMELVGEAGTGREAIEGYRRLRPDVVLVDLRLPDMDAVEVTASIRRLGPSARVVVLTSFGGEEDVYRALRAGAATYLLKDVPRGELMDCIRDAHAGRPCLPPEMAAKLVARLSLPELTERELHVLRLVATGKGNKEIGGSLNVAEGTIKAHVNRIFRKLGVATRSGAVTAALKRGIVRLEDA